MENLTGELFRISIREEDIVLKKEGTLSRFVLPIEEIASLPMDIWEKISETGKNAITNTFVITLQYDQITAIKEVSQEEIIKWEEAPKTLKGMTCHAPFAYAIAMQKNSFELRYKNTKHRDWLLLHAGLSKDSDEAFEEYNISPNVTRGAIIGAAFLYEVDYDGVTYAFKFRQRQLFDSPIPFKGKQATIWGAKDKLEQQAFDRAWNQINKDLIDDGDFDLD